jgi:alginate biosynthesis protein AlgX
MIRAAWCLVAAVATVLFTIAPAVAEMPQPFCEAAGDGGQFTDRNTRVRGVFAGKDGWLSSPSELREDYEAPDVASMKLIVDALAAKGTKLVMAVMPMRPLVYPEKMPDGAMSPEELELHRNQYRQTILELRSAGILATDNLEVFLAAKDRGDVYFARDHHWTPFGAEVVAQAIGELIKQDPGFPASNLSFIDTDMGTMQNKGSFLSAVQSLCNDNTLAAEPMQRIQTELSQEGVGLFTEQAPPKIVLAGTSFSRKWVGDMFNFGGSLEHATGEEVLNVAINGGGAWSAMQAYLSSDEFQAQPPAYLIWESANVFGKPNSSVVAQLLGSIQGKCDINPIFETTAPADLPLEVVLDDMEGIAGPAYHMEVSFTDLESSKVNLSFVGSSGNQEFNLSLPAEKRDGRFLAELPRDVGNIEKLVVTPTEGLTGDLRIAVCASGVSTPAVAEAIPVVDQTTPDLLTAPSQPETTAATAQSTEGGIAIELFGDAYQGNPILQVEINGQIAANEKITSLKRRTPQTVLVDPPSRIFSLRLRRK